MKSVYTDGACKGNPGPGGWGVYLAHENEAIEIYGSDFDTTNNRMELMAAIIGTKLVFENEQAKIYTDSQYVIKGITEWMIGWKKNGWKTSKKEPVKNADLWRDLDSGIQNKKIEWVWVKGHNGDHGNTKADDLANKGAAGNSNYHELEKIVNSLKRTLENNVVKKEETLKNVVNSIDILESGLIIKHTVTNESFCLIELNLSVWNSDKLVHKIISLDNIDKSYLLTEVALKKEFEFIVVDKTLYKKRLQILNKQPTILKDLYLRLKQECQHEIVETKYEGATCSICKDYFGHYCPDSPDHACHYFTHEGLVELIDGKLVKPPEGHGEYGESDDWCIYCHAPQERK